MNGKVLSEQQAGQGTKGRGNALLEKEARERRKEGMRKGGIRIRITENYFFSFSHRKFH